MEDREVAVKGCEVAEDNEVTIKDGLCGSCKKSGNVEVVESGEVTVRNKRQHVAGCVKIGSSEVSE